LATLTLYIKHYKDDQGVEHIDIDQRLTGGIAGTIENRTLDWTFRVHSDYLFGPCLGRSRRVKLDEIEHDYLRKGWLPDIEEHGAINAYVESDTSKSGRTWNIEQVGQRFSTPSLGRLPYPPRFGHSKKSMAKGDMPDTSTSTAPRVRTFRPDWSMTSVSLLSKRLI